jgi:hypothetical protein
MGGLEEQGLEFNGHRHETMDGAMPPQWKLRISG